MTQNQQKLAEFLENEGLKPFLQAVPQAIHSAYEQCWMNSSSLPPRLHHDAYARGIQWYVDGGALNLARKFGLRAREAPNKRKNCRHAEVLGQSSTIVLSRVWMETEEPRHADFREELQVPNTETLFEREPIELTGKVGLTIVHEWNKTMHMRPDFIYVQYPVPGSSRSMEILDLYTYAVTPIVQTVSEEVIMETFVLALKEETAMLSEAA